MVTIAFGSYYEMENIKTIVHHNLHIKLQNALHNS